MSETEPRKMATIRSGPDGPIRVSDGKLFCDDKEVSLDELAAIDRAWSGPEQRGLFRSWIQYHTIAQPDDSAFRIRSVRWRGDSWYEYAEDKQCLRKIQETNNA